MNALRSVKPVPENVKSILTWSIADDVLKSAEHVLNFVIQEWPYNDKSGCRIYPLHPDFKIHP
jgi:hypothetical protein